MIILDDVPRIDKQIVRTLREARAGQVVLQEILRHGIEAVPRHLLVGERLSCASGLVQRHGIVNDERILAEVAPEHGLCRREDPAGESDALAHALVARPEPHLVLDDRPADREAELIALQLLGTRGEEIAGVQLRVPQELECLAVKCVGASDGRDVDHGRIRPLVGHEEARLHLELVHVGDRYIDRQLSPASTAHLDSVDRVTVVRRFHAADHNEAARMPDLAREARTPLGGSGAARKQGEFQEVPAVQGQLVDAFGVDYGSDGV